MAVQIKFGVRLRGLVQEQGLPISALRAKVPMLTDRRFSELLNGTVIPLRSDVELFAAALDVSPVVLEGDGRDLESLNREELIEILRTLGRLDRFQSTWPLLRELVLDTNHFEGRPFARQTILRVINGHEVEIPGLFPKCSFCGSHAVGDKGKCRVCKRTQDVNS